MNMRKIEYIFPSIFKFEDKENNIYISIDGEKEYIRVGFHIETKMSKLSFWETAIDHSLRLKCGIGVVWSKYDHDKFETALKYYKRIEIINEII